MTKCQALIVLALTIGMAMPASAGVGDPETIIYRFPGVLDGGGNPSVGVATSFHCTNFSGVPENIRFVVRNFDTSMAGNSVITVPHLKTATVSTHNTTAFREDTEVSPGVVIDQGTMAIAATSINVICTAMIIDASTFVPHGVALRGIRF